MSPQLEQIEDVLADEIIASHNGVYQHLLIKWKDCPKFDATWITISDFRHHNPDLLEHSPEESYFISRENDGN